MKVRDVEVRITLSHPDYVDDQRVRYRINRVLKSVKLEELPESLLNWLPNARQRVYELAPVMLTPPVAKAENG